MKKILWACIATFVMVMTAPAAHADHVNHTYMSSTEGTAWGANNGFTICLSQEFDTVMNETQEGYAENSAILAFNAWEDGTSFPSGAWDEPSTSNCGDFDFNHEFEIEAGGNRATFCNSVPEVGNRNSSIQIEDLPQTILAETVTCDRNENDDIDYFVIVINEQCVQAEVCGPNNDDFHLDGTDITIPDFHYDLRGVLTHEFGHAVGFDGYLNGAGHLIGDCTESPSLWNTMCATSGYGYYNRGNGTDLGTYDRTTDSHDNGVVNQNY